MSLVLHTEIKINAPTSKVWNVLTDMEKYAEWNPFIVNAKGKVQLGEKLLCQPKLPGGRQYSFRPTITRYIDGKEFAWTGDVIHSSLASGEHIFILESVGNNESKLIHDEIFSGLFAPLFMRVVKDKTEEGFILMNESLKKICELDKA